MKNFLSTFLPMAALAVILCSSNPGVTLQEPETVFLNKRDFLINDTSLKVKPAFISLPAGAVRPLGWIKDQAVTAANGITGHLDEWSPIWFGLPWRGIDGSNPWPLEPSAYWLDGAIRLSYMIDDPVLKNKITTRLNTLVNGVLRQGNSFIYWKNLDYTDNSNYFENWSHSHIGRALVAYYEASGDPRVLEALVKVYGNFDLVPVPYIATGNVSGCVNADPMLDTYALSKDKRILDIVLAAAKTANTQETVLRWNNKNFDNAHGVILYENIRIPAMMYPWTNDLDLLNATQAHLDWFDETHLLPHGVVSSEEYVAGIGSTRNVETCNVATSAWTYQQMYEITGESQYGDRIERIFFNAAQAPVARDYQTMAYYHSPNHIEGLLPYETPLVPDTNSDTNSTYVFRPLGLSTTLCCVGNIARAIPNYVMHLWMATTDKGIAATLYGPSVVNTVVGENVPLTITSETNYPFNETIRMTVEPDVTCTFPVYLRIPQWCKQPQIKVNGEVIAVTGNESGFVKVDRTWKTGDVIDLELPMQPEVVDGTETSYPSSNQMLYSDYYTRAGNRPLAKEKNVNSPYRTVNYGPLLFALPVKDINPNQQAPNQKWNYALYSKDKSSIKVVRSEMPEHWSWQIEDAPVKLVVKAAEFNWNPTSILPLPKDRIVGGEETEITLVPYGCTKFRISMFPIAITKKQDGIAFWSHSAGWSLDLDGDGRIDKTFVSGLPEAAKTFAAFVGDCNQDGWFDLCEVGEDESGSLLWHFFVNDGDNNFELDHTLQYGLKDYKVLAGDLTGDGRMQPSVRVDTFDDANGWWEIYWLIRSWDPDVADPNFQFGITENDLLLAGDLNDDGREDLVTFYEGNWYVLFSRAAGFPPGWTWKLYGQINNMTFGQAGDIPVILDFNGDGRKDMGVFHPASKKIDFNFYSATKPDNLGYSQNGAGLNDASYLVPAGLTPTSVCAIKRSQNPNFTGIKTPTEKKEQLRIYPNPFRSDAGNTLQIALSSSIADKSCEVYVTTVAGQRVFSTVSKPQNGEIVLNIPALSRGIYFATVKNAGTAKLIVK